MGVVNIKIAFIQIKVVSDKNLNLDRAKQLLIEAAENGSDIIVLPEMFICPYNNDYFLQYGEVINENSQTVKMLSNIAKEKEVYIIGGSIPEIDNGKLYNSSVIFDDYGEIIGKHRKVHLFDIDIKNKIRYFESDVLTPGDKVTVVETKFGKIGVCICYDIRFPELIKKMANEGANMIIAPSAFNMVTGPAHWEIIARSRALDNQIYFGMCSPSRNLKSNYTAYGHSIIANPWGQVINELDENEGILYSEIDFSYIKKVREELPILKQKRNELY